MTGKICMNCAHWSKRNSGRYMGDCSELLRKRNDPVGFVAYTTKAYTGRASTATIADTVITGQGFGCVLFSPNEDRLEGL